jgi:hypothetical protein
MTMNGTTINSIPEHRIDPRTGEMFNKMRSLQDVFNDLDTWRDIVTRIHFDGMVPSDDHVKLCHIYERLHDDTHDMHIV